MYILNGAVVPQFVTIEYFQIGSLASNIIVIWKKSSHEMFFQLYEISKHGSGEWEKVRTGREWSNSPSSSGRVVNFCMSDIHGIMLMRICLMLLSSSAWFVGLCVCVFTGTGPAVFAVHKSYTPRYTNFFAAIHQAQKGWTFPIQPACIHQELATKVMHTHTGHGRMHTYVDAPPPYQSCPKKLLAVQTFSGGKTGLFLFPHPLCRSTRKSGGTAEQTAGGALSLTYRHDIFGNPRTLWAAKPLALCWRSESGEIFRKLVCKISPSTVFFAPQWPIPLYPTSIGQL